MKHTGSTVSTDGGSSTWTAALNSLRRRLSPRRLDDLAWNSCFLERTSSTVRVAADVIALHRWVNDGRLSLLDSAIRRLSDGTLDLAVLPSPTHELSDPLRALDRFIASPANRAAHLAARALTHARSAGPQPLLIHGPSGSGKSQLLRSIAGELAAHDPTASTLETDGHELCLGLVAALREGRLEAFRSELLDSPTLLIDNVHHLEGRSATQDELANTLEQRATRHLPVVLTSLIPPAELSGLEQPLRTYLQRCHCARLTPPEWETRVAIVLDRMSLWQVAAVPEAASFLSSTLGTDLARLDATLTRLMTHPGCATGFRDPELMRRILDDPDPVAARVAPHEVMRMISRHFSIRLSELRSSARSPRVNTPRQLAMYLLRHHCDLSYPEIGRRFRRHHTTAMHACRRIEVQREKQSSLRATVLMLEKELLERSREPG